MRATASSGQTSRNGRWGFFVAFICLTSVLSALFYGAFEPGLVVFSNDGPLGVQNAESYAMPAAFKGIWVTLYWLGLDCNLALASVTNGLSWLLGPVGYSKFYEPISLLMLGMCAWSFFRSIGLNPGLCVVASLGAALNGNFFSNAAWGLGSRPLAMAFVFLALGALNARHIGRPWLNAMLAGLAVGMGVVEGLDNGVIFSLFVAAFVGWQSYVEGGSPVERVKKGLRLVLVTAFAAFMATQSLMAVVDLGFLKTKAAPVEMSPQEADAIREADWNFATQWSLPPKETLRVIIPGLYGYRMDGRDGKPERAYWGRVGEYAPNPELGRRSSGAGEYAGVLVVLLSLWALVASFSKSLNAFSPKERKFIWFWAGAVVVSVVLAWGRFTPLYQFVYALPFFSSIRNPIKFMHAAHMALMILFGYGLLGMSRRYLRITSTPLSFSRQIKTWWSKAAPFEKRWTWGVALVLAASGLGYLLYASSRQSLANYLFGVGFPDSSLAAAIASYSIHEVGLFVIWLAISGLALLLIMGGVFAGKRFRWAVVLLGLVLTVDLARANLPWIVFWNYPYKYATNPIVDFLHDRPFKGRVTAPPQLMSARIASSYGGYNGSFPNVYGIEWVQQLFPYYNVQCFDVAQDPRPAADKKSYTSVMGGVNYLAITGVRYWQLTNTRYILGLAGYLDVLNTRLDKGQNRFRIVKTFDVEARPGAPANMMPQDLTVGTNASGPWALFEFTGALPRVKLYSHWQVSTNDDATLTTLTNAAFDPWETVLVSDEIAPSSVMTTNTLGSAEITDYKSKRIEIRADVTEPSILLLNDRFDPDWHVTVDGQAARLLRCNFIMRGVQLQPGNRTVIFTFQPSLVGLKISLVAIGLGVVLCVLLFFVRQPETLDVSDAVAAPVADSSRKAQRN